MYFTMTEGLKQILFDRSEYLTEKKIISQPLSKFKTLTEVLKT